MLHRHILEPAQLRALELLSVPSRKRRLHLGGGTAIALHLGHRRSVDLDGFAPEPIGDPARLAASLRREEVTGCHSGWRQRSTWRSIRRLQTVAFGSTASGDVLLGCVRLRMDLSSTAGAPSARVRVEVCGRAA